MRKLRAFLEPSELLLAHHGTRTRARDPWSAETLPENRASWRVGTNQLGKGGVGLLNYGCSSNGVSSGRPRCAREKLARAQKPGRCALWGLRGRIPQHTRPRRTLRAAVKDTQEVYRALKPIWCQPWSIVLTGLLITVVSWTWLPFRPYLAAAISGGVLFWWYLFLWEYPRIMKEDLPRSRLSTRRSREATSKKH
jgi:hypothetical protein